MSALLVHTLVWSAELSSTACRSSSSWLARAVLARWACDSWFSAVCRRLDASLSSSCRRFRCAVTSRSSRCCSAIVVFASDISVSSWRVCFSDATWRTDGEPASLRFRLLTCVEISLRISTSCVGVWRCFCHLHQEGYAMPGVVCRSVHRVQEKSKPKSSTKLGRFWRRYIMTGINLLQRFPPHIDNVSALPCENSYAGKPQPCPSRK